MKKGKKVKRQKGKGKNVKNAKNVKNIKMQKNIKKLKNIKNPKSNNFFLKSSSSLKNLYTWPKSGIHHTSSMVSQNLHFPKTQGALPLVGYTSVTSVADVTGISTSVTRPLHVRYTSVTRRLRRLRLRYFGCLGFWEMKVL